MQKLLTIFAAFSLFLVFGFVALPSKAEEDLFAYIKTVSNQDLRAALATNEIADINIKDDSGNTLLHTAAQSNPDEFVVKALLKAKIDLFARNDKGLSAAYLALDNPELNVLRTLLEAGSIKGRFYDADNLLLYALEHKTAKPYITLIMDYKPDVNVKDKEGRTPLMTALKSNARFQVIEELLDKGADVEAKDINGTSPLMYAVKYNTSPSVLATLPMNKASITQTDNQGRGVLLYAFANSAPDIVAIIRQNGGSLKEGDYKALVSDTNTFLNFCKYASLQELRAAIALGADVKAKDDKGRTAPMYAARYNPVPAVTEMLFKNGADAKAIDDDKQKVMDYAEKSFNKDKLIPIILKYGAYGLNQGEKGRPDFLDLVKIGNIYQIGMAVQEGANPNMKDFYGQTALMLAAEFNQDIQVSELLLRYGLSVKDKDQNGLTPILHAVRNNPNPEVIALLIKTNPISLSDKADGKTLLMFATENPNIEILNLLIKNQVPVNAKDKSGKTALVYAVDRGDIAQILVLLKAGAYIPDVNNAAYGKLIKLALTAESTDILKLLLQQGINVNAPLSDDKTIFMYAAAVADNKDIIALLLKHQADMNLRFKDSYPLFEALENNKNQDVIKLLISKQRDFGIVNKDNETLLSVAVRTEQPLPILELLNEGIRTKDAMTHSLLQSVSNLTDNAKLLLLTEAGADVRAKDEHGVSVLNLALRDNPNVEIIESLFGLGARADKDSLFLVCSFNSNPQVAEALLKYGKVKIDARDDNGETALFKAAARGSYKLVKILADAGANFKIRNNKGQNVLHLAAASDNVSPELIAFLTGLGVRVNQLDNDEESPLKKAIDNNCSFDVFTAFLETGAKTKLTFKDGSNLLIAAAKNNQNPEIIRYLLDDGINVNTRDKYRKTALFYAKSNPNTDIAAILSKAGAR